MGQFNISILGYGEHGKDEFANYLAEALDIELYSSSMFACERIIFPWFKKQFPNHYIHANACYEDRRNWRALWHKLISNHNTPDKTLLASEILETYEGYVGMRCIHELTACKKKGLFNAYFWVDASERKPLENAASNSIHYDPAYMIRVDNNGSKDDLRGLAAWAAAVIRQL